MRFAVDKDNNRIHIDQTHANDDYFCPSCGEKLVMKKGKIRTHHFSHPSHSICTDSWHYDMSEWHTRWQDRFPLETQEISKSKDGKKHRADVLLEKEKIVFEFQHSSLEPEEFDDRNSFYNSLGYKVIWIFDFCEQYENGSFENYKRNIYSWSRPRKTFRHFVPKNNPSVELYFQIQNSAEEDESLQELKDLIDCNHPQITNREKVYYIHHKNDKIELIRITWAADGRFERFATDGETYFVEDIMSKYVHKPTFSSEKEVDSLPTRTETENKTLSTAETVFELWKKGNYKVAIFKNVNTGTFIKINRDPNEQRIMYGKVHGYFSKDQYSFKGPWSEIFYCDSPEWTCVWNKSKEN